MIANITQSSNLAPLLNYNKNKVLAQKAIELDYGGNLFKKEAKYAEYIIATYGNNIVSNRKDKFLHVSLNFLPNDNAVLNDYMLKDIVKDYLAGIGFSADHPYIVYKHDDTVHPHVHIVTSKLDENGKCITKSNNYRQSQRVTRELEIKYNLTKVSSQKLEAMVDKRLANAPSLRDKLNFHIKYALDTLLVQNMAQFNLYLNDNGLDALLIAAADFNDDKHSVYDGLIYNNLTNDFLQSQKGIKASSLYLKPTMKNLEISFLRNKEIQQIQKGDIKKVLDYAFNKYEKMTLVDLQRQLNVNNIEVKFKSDSNDQLVGISFRKVKSAVKYSGENIGKKYTARNISIFIGEKTVLKSQVKFENSIPKEEFKQITIKNSNIIFKENLPDQSTHRMLNESESDVLHTQVNEDIYNDQTISDIDKKKKLDPFKRRIRKM